MAKWVNELPKLQEVSIPRCFKPPGFKTDHIELHTFCDASQVGYGAVSYLRMTSQNGVIRCSFVLGKSRVTPRKQITIPRLELCSAVLAVKLSRFVLKELEYKVNNVYYWTDSTSVLQYLSNTSARYHVFVANRVAQIRNSSAIVQWRHVDTKNNPADVASRDLSPRCIDKAISWFNAPEFLWHSQEHWPKRPEVLPQISENDPEVKTVINTKVDVAKDNVKSVQEGHSGTLHVLAVIRERYWIIHGQSTVRSYLRKCLKCRMQRAKVGKQVMAPLPASRVTPGHPAYTWTGIDYMGPVLIKQGRSTIKRYVCVFTCMSSRAVHLEVSHSLETNSFLNALERFSSRHIMPKEIYCDNASTFVGAEREPMLQ
uniref:uncharacterized protein LOC120340408 n=1 Tax=Styela clava TaxID=7725 RepID=UPI00193927F2|nr:uncharacterized protein LOC120340408 [Styela clava]